MYFINIQLRSSRKKLKKILKDHASLALCPQIILILLVLLSKIGVKQSIQVSLERINIVLFLY